MHGNILTPPPGQVAPSLGDLAAAIRGYHTNILAAFSTAANYAVEAGLKLATAKRCAGHGRWGEFLRSCEIGERTARRYMQLAELVEQNGRGTTDLTGVTIEQAIKLLAPPKPTTTPKPAAAKKALASPKLPEPKVVGGKHTSHTAIISAWMTATPTERVKAINAIGLGQVLAAMPASWMPLLEQRLADRQSAAPRPAASLAVIPDNLSIPESLKRPLPAAPRPAAEKAAAMHGDGPSHSSVA